MPTPDQYNPVANVLVPIFNDNKFCKKDENLAVLCNVHLELSDLLQKEGYNVRSFYQFGQLLRAVNVENYLPKVVIMCWSDRDTWRAFELLPVHIKVLSLFQGLFKTGEDHPINNKFLQKKVGQSQDNRIDGRLVSWDNRLYEYNFQT